MVVKVVTGIYKGARWQNCVKGIVVLAERIEEQWRCLATVRGLKVSLSGNETRSE